MLTENRADKLRRARSSYAVIWNRFILGYQKNPKCLFCFFEGDDSKYYAIRIELLVAPDNVAAFDCDGKDGVLTLLQLVTTNSQYSSAWVAFFIDKDFDNIADFPKDDRLYITPCYSIENLYASPTAFTKIIQSEFQITGLGDDEKDFATVTNLYHQRLEQFNDVMEEINAWIFLHRQLEKSVAGCGRLNLTSVNLDKLFSVKLGNIEKKYSVESLAAMFPEAQLIDRGAIGAKVAEFRSLDRTLFF